MKDLIDYSRETGTGPMGKLFLLTANNDLSSYGHLRNTVFKIKWFYVIFIIPDRWGNLLIKLMKLIFCSSRLSTKHT